MFSSDITSKMFVFVVWAVGIAVLFRLAFFNVDIAITAFKSHWFWGLSCALVSLVIWGVLVVWLLFL